MEKNIVDERVLAFSMATEIDTDEMEQVSGGSAGRSQYQTAKETAMGRDKTIDYDYD